MEKRGLDSDDPDEGQSNNKRQALSSVIVESFKEDSLQQLCSSLAPVLSKYLVPILLKELHTSLGPELREFVSEEVERTVGTLDPARLSGRPSPKPNEGPHARNLQLHFRSRLALPIFTEGKVEGERGAGVVIVLFDGNIDCVVTDGPESSAKLDLVVLEGNFNDDTWTKEKFERHVVKEREGKRPLLTGDLQVTLKGGVATLGDLTFTDNSSWIPSGKFRLGAKVASGYCKSLRVREAKTDAFTVKDRRGELYKKHHPPASNDEVWRLKKIGKDGSLHRRLNEAGIHTVEDFLRLLNRDSERLRSILGRGMSNKMWGILIEHAKTCVLSGKRFVFFADDTKNEGVVFNSIYELCGLIASGLYYPADSLSNSQKVYVETLVEKAYDNWNHALEYNGKAPLSFEQNRQPIASLSEVPLSQQDCPTSVNQQGSMLNLPVPVSPSQSSIASGLIISGYNDVAHVGTSYLANPHQVNSNAHIQFDGSVSQQKQLNSASSQYQMSRNDTMVGLASGQVQAFSSGFQTGGPSIDPSNLTPYANEVLAEDENHMSNHENFGAEVMQHLFFVLGMGNQNSINASEDAHFNSPLCVSVLPTNYNQEDEHHNPFQSTNYRSDEEDLKPNKIMVALYVQKSVVMFVEAGRRAKLREQGHGD